LSNIDIAYRWNLEKLIENSTCPDIPYIYTNHSQIIDSIKGIKDEFKIMPILLTIPNPRLNNQNMAISFLSLVYIIEAISIYSLSGSEINKNECPIQKLKDSETVVNKQAIENFIKSILNSQFNNRNSLRKTNFSLGFSKLLDSKKISLKFYQSNKLHANFIYQNCLSYKLSEKTHRIKAKSYQKIIKNQEIDSKCLKTSRNLREEIFLQNYIDSNSEISKGISNYFNNYFSEFIYEPTPSHSYYNTHNFNIEKQLELLKKEIIHKIIIIPGDLFPVTPYQKAMEQL